MKFSSLRTRLTVVSLCCLTAAAGDVRAAESSRKEPASPDVANHRRPANEDELRYWLENMVWYHRFTVQEITSAMGMEADEVRSALAQFDIRNDNRPRTDPDCQKKILVLPYPGGRHPRVGHRLAAIRPQRESKISIFAPWDQESYVVVDVPEAIEYDLGVLYLAHTHVPTFWTERNIVLERLEWNRHADGSLDIERRLPNGVSFTTRVDSTQDGAQMSFSLTNGTDRTLTRLRMTPCAILRGAKGFEQQTNDNKVLKKPFAACRSVEGNRWIITTWEGCREVATNSKCPCLHSDPPLWVCEPGETVRARGWLTFYEGTDIEEEFRRLEKLVLR
jgi:hypothetical protein